MRASRPWLRARARALLLLCLFGAGSLGGCQGAPEASAVQPLNAARYTLHSEPPVEFLLDRLTIENRADPERLRLQWQEASGELLFRAQPLLEPGVSSLAGRIIGYSVPGRFAETAYQEEPCEQGCQGTERVQVAFSKRQRVVELEVAFRTDVPRCSVQHQVSVDARGAMSFAVCSASRPCTDLGGCCCQPVLPCSGSFALNRSELCANPDFSTVSLPATVQASAEVPDF